MALFGFGDKPKTFTQNEVNTIRKEAVQKAVLQAAELVQNDTGVNMRNHLSQIISGGYDSADTLHNIYLDYGYPGQLSFSNYWNMYRRFGIAKNVVEKIPETQWSTYPEIEGPEAFTSDLQKIVDRLNLWNRLKGLDTRQRVGRYAGLFMRVRDGKDPSEPIDATLPGEKALADIIPLYESQLEVLETNSDPKSEEYGEPTKYQYNGGVVGNRNENNRSSFSIDPSRVIVFAEDSDNGFIYGMSSLEAPYNSLMDLRKIIGAGGEGFYKNAAQSVIFKLMETQNAAQLSSLLENFNEQYDDFTKDRMRRGLWTPGLDPQTLDSNLANPKDFFNVALNDVAAAVKIPATILIGQQTGRLASTEDGSTFLSMVQSRRMNFGTEMVRGVLDWFIKYGVLPSADYEAGWDDLLARSEDEKLGAAKKMSEINKDQFSSGGDMPFTGEEIRETAGFDPEEMPEPDESLDDVEDEPEAFE